MAFSPSFFDFQLQFARHISDQFNLSFADALFHYTTLSKTLGKSNWEQFVTQLDQAPNATEWTYQWHLQHRSPDPQRDDTTFLGHPLFGCFYYLVRDESIIRIHFIKNDPQSLRPLSRERKMVRQEELQRVFTHIYAHVPTAKMVLGNSWMYNLEAYCRLYPPGYVEQLPVSNEAEFQFLAFWGQCFDYLWNPKPVVIQAVLQNLKALHNLDDLRWCFPYQILQPSCPISLFYDFYGVG